MNEWLYKRTSSGKIQSWRAIYSQVLTTTYFQIIVEFGQLNGKIQEVSTEIFKGKQKRNIQEQAEFEVQALYKSKKDEGYKSLDDLGITNLISLHGDPILCLQEKLEEHLPKHNTNADGHLKVMLSQPISRTSKGVEKDFWDKVVYPCALEPKLDGVRCTTKKAQVNSLYQLDELFYIPVNSFSRESMDYNFGTNKIREKLLPIFQKYPDLVLDGELYKHDIPQNHISGAMRSKGSGEHKYVFNIMEYHVYDIIDTDLTFEERRKFLVDLAIEFPEAFVLNPLHIVETKEDVDLLEEKYVNEDYEGIMLKNLNGMYRPDVRSYDSIKVKRFYDEEFRVMGFEFGSRGVQDLVIKCETKDGIPFLATAMGTVADKELLKTTIHKKLHNEMVRIYGTVKYKFISENGKPSHANFKGLR